ncbi:rhodanese-like domain-containing protein [Streptomyces sp. AJS327]|uniref:rhodanese-like domain-containing protein n=1 Tax=Streptomyces sp. AJS327 TaxID=2545265 RepID=UPI0015DE6240|nr:rhodanese-like domain-containing protein [Streptomyces sp. AJS327]MBA0050143.1 rhodanese-like domain-containing protein [Streptomyces sp. AJS327]
MSTTPVRTLDAAATRSRLTDLTIVDVRTPGEYASGHLPGAHNIPLDRIGQAVPALREAAERSEVLVVCASGNRSRTACASLAELGVTALSLEGGTGAWAADGGELERVEGGPAVWGMERQVRLTAGLLVLLGLGLALLHPAFALLSAGVAGGLVFSALTNTCGMAALLAKLPHNRSRACDLNTTVAALRRD